PGPVVGPQQRLAVQIGKGGPESGGIEPRRVNRVVDQLQAFAAILYHCEEEINFVLKVVIRSPFAHTGALEDAVDVGLSQPRGGKLWRSRIEHLSPSRLRQPMKAGIGHRSVSFWGRRGRATIRRGRSGRPARPARASDTRRRRTWATF